MAININNMGNNTPLNAKQAEQRNQQQVQQNNQQGQSAQQANAPRQDSVSLTNSAQQLNNAQKKAQDAPGFDQSKVDKIKKAISEGGYKVDAERLASNIIASEGKLFGL